MAAQLSTTAGSAGQPAVAADAAPPGGLGSDEARRRLEKSGPNAMPNTSEHPWSMALEKFWAPVPWMLEATVMLELVLGKYAEAAIIAFLLVFNAALGLFQESRDAGHRWHRHEAAAGMGGCSSFCGSLRLRAYSGPGEGSGSAPPQHQLTGRTMMKINFKDFRVREGDEVDLKKWPTLVDPVYDSIAVDPQTTREVRIRNSPAQQG